MKRHLLASLVFFYSSTIEKKDKTQVIARVNNHTLTIQKLEGLLHPGDRTDNQIKTFINDWIERTLLYDAAINAGLKKDAVLLHARDRFYEKLLGSSFMSTRTLGRSTITEKDVRDYYQENKLTFSRTVDDAVVRSFSAPTLEEAQNIKKTLKNRRGKGKMAELFKKYSVETKTVKRGHITKDLDLAIFSARKNNILGPVLISGNYFIIDVLRFNKAGSLRGLEDAYDEIYQRLSKESDAVLFQKVVDSLYSASSVFISPNIQEQ